jgi:hypothetical protein
LLTRVKKPAVATAAFCEVRPTATPASAAVVHGACGGGVDTAVVSRTVGSD